MQYLRLDVLCYLRIATVYSCCQVDGTVWFVIMIVLYFRHRNSIYTTYSVLPKSACTQISHAHDFVVC